MIKTRIEEVRGKYVLYEITRYKYSKPEKTEIFRGQNFNDVFNFMKQKYGIEV